MIPALRRPDDERALQLREPLREHERSLEVERSVTHVGIAILVIALGFVAAGVALFARWWTGGADPADRAQAATACLLGAMIIGGVLGGIGQLLQIRAELRARRPSDRGVIPESPPGRTGVTDLDAFRRRPGSAARDESSDRSFGRDARRHGGPH